MIEDFFVPMTRKKPSTFSKNAQFEGVPSYANTTINGYIGSRSNMEQMIGGKWTIKAQLRFYCDTECIHGDEILFNNETYRVIGKMQNTIGLGHHYKGQVEHCTNID